MDVPTLQSLQWLQWLNWSHPGEVFQGWRGAPHSFSVTVRRSPLSLFPLRQTSLLIHMDLSQQSLSVWDVPLPPVGPVNLQPLLLSLGVFQHALPPQALHTQHLTAAPVSSVPPCEQHLRLLAVLFAPASAATELSSILWAEGSEFGQQDLRLMGALQGRQGPQQWFGW